MIELNNFRCLLAADAASDTENELLQKKINLRSDILKVSHHGWEDASSQEFLKAVSPKFSIISVDSNNIRGYPSKEVIKRLEEAGSKIYITHKDGDIVASVSPDGKIDITTDKN
jgi:beta-lactamase superfamily II metal-dependent hydrolase